MSAIPQEWIERGADAVYRHAARLGVPAYTLTVGQLVTVALEGAVPLIREALAQKVETRREERLASDWASIDESMEDHEAGMDFAFRIAAHIIRGGDL